MPGSRPGARWRGWEAADATGTAAVTSERLGSNAAVKNRWFPKIRSWFALGAPLELLSPLSVARILLGFGTVVVFLTLVLSTHRFVWPTALVLVVALGGTLASARVKVLGALGCHAVVAGSIVVVDVVLLDCDSGASAVAGFCLLLVAIFAGLFLHPRVVLAYQALAAVGLFLALAPRDDLATAIGAALGMAIAATAVAMTVSLVAFSARRSGMVDPDTGLPNGFGLAERLEDLGDQPYVIATTVLRGLAEARQALGYQVGTELVRRAVEDLGQVLPQQAAIARVAGDELVVAQRVQIAPAAPGEAHPQEALAAAAHATAEALGEQLRDAIASGRYVADGVEVALRAHVGVAVAPVDGTDPTELIRRASVAAHHAVDAGLAQARWEGVDGALTSADLAMLADLRMAGERGELWVAYQPQIAAATGRTVAVEALMRWDSPRHGSVPPGVFIPLAERLGLIDRLTDWVLDHVLDAQVRWVADGMWLPVSVNFSAISLSNPDLAEGVLRSLRERDLSPSLLNVEVTETAAVDVVQAVDRLRPLHEHGVRVSIDDFGTGYTSLSILPHLPIDELKVDQRFVRATSTSPADIAIVEAVADLAHRLGLDAVAEGVEDLEISERMRAIGFDLLQGYHFARPMPEHDLMRFVADIAPDSVPPPPPAGAPDESPIGGTLDAPADAPVDAPVETAAPAVARSLGASLGPSS